MDIVNPSPHRRPGDRTVRWSLSGCRSFLLLAGWPCSGEVSGRPGRGWWDVGNSGGWVTAVAFVSSWWNGEGPGSPAASPSLRDQLGTQAFPPLPQRESTGLAAAGTGARWAALWTHLVRSPVNPGSWLQRSRSTPGRPHRDRPHTYIHAQAHAHAHTQACCSRACSPTGTAPHIHTGHTSGAPARAPAHTRCRVQEEASAAPLPATLPAPGPGPELRLLSR